MPYHVSTSIHAEVDADFEQEILIKKIFINVIVMITAYQNNFLKAYSLLSLQKTTFLQIYICDTKKFILHGIIYDII
jgi:hypothetical protein